MTWKEKLRRRVLPLWAGAAALFILPHACRGVGRASARWGLLAYLALLFPLVWALYHFTAMRTWRGLVAAAAAFAAVAGAFFLSAPHIGLREATELPALAGAGWLVVAIRALRDPAWRWADACRALVPGRLTCGFLAWAALAAGAWYAWLFALPYGLPPVRPGGVAWACLFICCLAALFQLAGRASRSFTARCAVAMAAAAYALVGMKGFAHLTIQTLAQDPAAAGIADLSVMGFFVFLLQDELARRLPGRPFLARQRAFVGWRTLAAAGVAAAVALGLAAWADSKWSFPPLRSMPLIAPAAGTAFVVFVHLALAARLSVPLATKLAVSGLALFAAMDLTFYVAPDLPRFLETGYDSGFLSAFRSLRTGMTGFAVMGWTALCAIAHSEYRKMPLSGAWTPPDGDESDVGGGRAAETGETRG